jgi:hypothetical protein
MKKYLLLFALGIVALCNNSYAGTVSLSDAQNVALNFFKVNNTDLNAATLSASLKYTKAEPNGRVDFYVFDISPSKGFVIVAADDNVIPVLAYSNSSNFRIDFDHTGVANWVHKTAANINLALQHNATADARIQNQWTAYRQGQNPAVLRSSTVGPLCTTTWDQENGVSNPPPFLYNLMCPYNNTDHQRALTGCVATAMAQIMKFWNYPAVGTGSFSYVDNTSNGYTGNYGTLSSNFAAHTYQWSQMPTILTGSESAAQDSAVDLLMYDCGVSVGMDYGDDNQGGSGAEGLLAIEVPYGDSLCSEYAFKKYFSYDPDTIFGAVEANYTASAWTALIKHDLDMGRVNLYEGNDTAQGGHAWVCDGYDANNLLHMNWGWSGADNGYFAINNLTTTGNFNPILEDAALIGILPKRAHASGISTVNGEVSFDMYPNPASHEVVIKTTTPSTLSLRNMLGQILISQNIEAEQTRIDLSGYEAGVYLVELRAGDKSVVKKLVVSR